VAATTGRLTQVRSDDPARPGWIGRLRRSLTFGLTDLDSIVVALAGFLLRGGIVLLVVPAAVLPSVIGIAGATGVDAFGIDGRPTPWLFQVAAIASVFIAAWLLLAFVVGSLVDVWLIEAALDGETNATHRPRPLPELRILLDMAGIRAVCLVPLAVAVAWASSGIYGTIYNELTVPSDLATPLPVRVIVGAAGTVIVVGLTWLVAETVAALAVRRLVILDTGVRRALVGAIVQLLRRPISSAATVAVSFGASLVATALAIIATATTFAWCSWAARDQQPFPITLGVSPYSTTRDFRPAIFLLAVLALGLAWISALALSGIASAWRSAAFTGETAAALAGTGKALNGQLGLSGSTTERSGD
jgi:hypothetical protein